MSIHRQDLTQAWRVVKYAFPYKTQLALIAIIFATYSAATTFRFALAGFLVDGVLVPAGGNGGNVAGLFDEVRDRLAIEEDLPAGTTTRGRFREIIVEGRIVQQNGEKIAVENGRITHLNGAPVDMPFDHMQVTGFNAREDLPGGALRLREGKLEYRWGAEMGNETRLKYAIVFAILAVALALIIAASSYLREYFSRRLFYRITVDIRRDAFDHLSTQSVAYFNGRKSGDLISRLTNDVGTVQRFLQETVMRFLQEPMAIIAAIGLAAFASWQLTLITLPMMVIIFYPVWKLGGRVRKHGRGSLQKLGIVTEAIQQLFSGIRVVKAFNMDRYQREEFGRKNWEYLRTSMRMVRAKVTGTAIMEFIYNFGTALFVVGGCYLIIKQAFGLALVDFAVFAGAMFSLYRPIKELTRAYNTLQESLGGSDRLFQILDEKPTIADEPDAADLEEIREGVIFEEVSFAYETPTNGGSEPRVLKDISFEARLGEVVAIVGPTGEGKSTLVDLIPRFYEPQSGSIKIDGVDIRRYTQRSLLRHIAIVGQDPFLFNTTVMENLRYGRPDATLEEVAEAARKACIDRVIDALPRGYDTGIGERGVRLSGGERQRLTIARAILKDAAILILDEATSALDSETEKVVQEALANLMRGRLTFVIAHRLSTITHADRILVMMGGQIVERGAHDDLIERQGAYYRLYQMQHAGVAVNGAGNNHRWE